MAGVGFGLRVKSGGRSRLSTLVAGVALLLMVVFLSDWVGRIPMAALVAVMIMVSIGTFRWESIRNLKRYPLSTSLVMLVTVGVVLATHNLAFGVVAGVLLASLFFANKIGRYLDIDSERSADGTRRHYRHADVAGLVGGNPLENGVQANDVAAAEGIGGIAIVTAQGAAGQAHEDRRQAGGTCFPLQRVENLGDAQGLLHIQPRA